MKLSQYLTKLDRNSFRGLLELFQLSQGRLDPLGHDGVHHEVLVEVALSRVAVALEHEEVAVVGDLASDRADLFRVEKFRRGPLFLLLLALALRGRRPQRASRPGVVDSRQQL